MSYETTYPFLFKHQNCLYLMNFMKKQMSKDPKFPSVLHSLIKPISTVLLMGSKNTNNVNVHKINVDHSDQYLDQTIAQCTVYRCAMISLSQSRTCSLCFAILYTLCVTLCLYQNIHIFAIMPLHAFLTSSLTFFLSLKGRRWQFPHTWKGGDRHAISSM